MEASRLHNAALPSLGALGLAVEREWMDIGECGELH